MNTRKDWRHLVRERLRTCDLPTATREEVITELATHLEERYEDALRRGLNEVNALDCAMQEVADWQVLAVDLSLAKSKENRMNTRTKTLWLPAMASLTGAASLLMILQKLGVQPRITWTKDLAMTDIAVLIYLPWLYSLPVFGALGAYLARRTHARPLTRLAAALAPSIAMVGAFCFMLVVMLLTDIRQFAHFPSFYFGLTMVDWVILPACALMLGALPFLKQERSPRLA